MRESFSRGDIKLTHNTHDCNPLKVGVYNQICDNMKITILLTLVLAALSCSDDDTVYAVTPELQPHVDSFYEEASVRGKNLSKANLIVKLDQVQAVIDVSKDGDQWIITLDPGFYNYYTEGQIEAIIFHELGKILLQRPIIDVPFGPEPVSIMNPYYKFGEYGAKRAVLLDELFK